ncbi:MAG: hypothetical protein WC823_00175 [Parcubacteria group bacterium]|jgi:hypothetical protein
MCKCTPNIWESFCGQPGCEWPKQEVAKPSAAEEVDELIIKPAGFTCSLIFEKGRMTCGDAHEGIGIRLSNEPGGGVLKLDDVIQIKNWIESHLKSLIN